MFLCKSWSCTPTIGPYDTFGRFLDLTVGRRPTQSYQRNTPGSRPFVGARTPTRSGRSDVWRPPGGPTWAPERNLQCLCPDPGRSAGTRVRRSSWQPVSVDTIIIESHKQSPPQYHYYGSGSE